MNKKKIALIACSKRKIKDGKKHYAKDIYLGSNFKKSLEKYQEFCDKFLILSDLHYVLEPNEKIEYYEVEVPLSKRKILEKKEWSEIVFKKLTEKFGKNIYRYDFYVFGSHPYYDYLPREMSIYSFRFNYRIIDLTEAFKVKRESTKKRRI